MRTAKLYSGNWMGEKVSDYGLENGYIDYMCLSNVIGDAVLCNDITKLFYADINGEYVEPEQENGIIDNSDEQPEIYQYYIISYSGADFLERYTDEIVYYIPALDMYIWGVTHWGTGWDYVLTDIKIEGENN